MNRQRKSILGYRWLCLVLAALLCLGSCGEKQEALSWQEQYDLGVRCLSEGNYQEAILAFEAAIQIDPKRPEAYASLADAYLAAGDEPAAKAALEEGAAATGDQSLADRLQGMELPPPQSSSPAPPAEDSLFAGPYLAPEEVELLQLDLDAASALVESEGIYALDGSIRTTDEDARFADFNLWVDTTNYLVCNIEQRNDADTVTRLRFSGWWDTGANIPSDIRIRGIHLGDRREEVLSVLGFSEEEISIIGDQKITVTRLLGGDQERWEQLGLIPDGLQRAPAIRQTELGTEGWLISLAPAGQGSQGMVDLLYRNGETGDYTNEVQLEFYNSLLNMVTCYAA